jgi:hypothetical protein
MLLISEVDSDDDGLWFQPHSITQHMNHLTVIESHFQNTLLHTVMILHSQPNILMFLGPATFFGDT